MQTVVLPRLLQEASEAVVPELRAALEHLSLENRRVVDYHMGWADSEGRPVSRRSSKSLRPALVLTSVESVGCASSLGVPAAVAVELIHNFAFLHDDIMDGDRQRRGRETAWAVFGVGRAMCAGSSLLALAPQVLLDSQAPGSVPAVRVLLDMVVEMGRGQALDLAFEGRSDVTLADCMEQMAAKTGSLVGCAASIGVVLVGGPEAARRELAAFGRSFGIALQAHDDFLGVWGRPEQTGGRPVGFDLRARKVTLPVAAASNNGGRAAEELRELLSHESLDESDVARATSLVEANGGRDTTVAEMRRFAAEALARLSEADIEDGARSRLAELVSLSLPAEL